MTFRPRVAFFTDSFHEVNGVALTSRQFDAFARRRQYPFLSVHAGPRTEIATEGSVTTLELQRGRAAFPVECDMNFDPLFFRYRKYVAGILRDFRADILHITGPSDNGILAAYLAHELKIPLVASWHTNLHEFAARRLHKLFRFLPNGPLDSLTLATEQSTLALCTQYYKLARVVLAPNQELVELLQQRTGQPAFLMQRGSDTSMFSPDKRDRADGDFVIGYVGRVTPEKNVRFLVEIERALIESGHANFRFLIIGDGSERQWLAANLKNAEFTGVLKGEALARAYANMDVFAFPSHTDTYGNVVIEALASGVPAVVTASGGPKYLIQSGLSGFVAADDLGFIRAIREICDDGGLLAKMRVAAREHARSLSWDGVFDSVYEAYEQALPSTLYSSRQCPPSSVTIS